MGVTISEPAKLGTFLSFFKDPTQFVPDSDLVLIAGFIREKPITIPQTEVVFDLLKYKLPGLNAIDCTNLVDVRAL